MVICRSWGEPGFLVKAGRELGNLYHQEAVRWFGMGRGIEVRVSLRI
jgi:hypothetical protein